MPSVPIDTGAAVCSPSLLGIYTRVCCWRRGHGNVPCGVLWEACCHAVYRRIAVSPYRRIAVAKGNYRAPPRPQWGRGSHVSPQ